MNNTAYLHLRIIILSTVVLLIMGASCKNESSAQAAWLEAVLASEHWKHSYEDDKEGLKAYRPASYSFPPARGRAAFRIYADNRFVDLPISPRDGNSELTGKWSVVGDKRAIAIVLDGGGQYQLEVESWGEGLLYLRRIDN